MNICSLYKRIIQENIDISYYLKNLVVDNNSLKMLISGSGLVNLDDRRVNIKHCECIDMSKITNKWFNERADSIEKEFLVHREDCLKNNELNMVTMDMENIKNEIVVPFDRFFLEMGKRKVMLHHDTGLRDVMTMWGCYVNFYRYPPYKENIGVLFVSVILGDSLGRPFIITIYPLIWKNDRTLQLTRLSEIAGEQFGTPQIQSSDAAVCIETLALALSWLAAKNIKLTPNEWTEKERNWSKKILGKPIEKHYTISVELPFKTRESVIDNKCIKKYMPLHLVRGHLRRYTEEKPLFGSLVGTFYIPSHTRGDEDNGTIKKDYEFKINRTIQAASQEKQE